MPGESWKMVKVTYLLTEGKELGGCLGKRCHLEKAASAKNNQVKNYHFSRHQKIYILPKDNITTCYNNITP